MQLTPSLEKVYTQEQYTARDAQALAHLISWGPVVFQVARLMICYGIFEMLSEKDNGMTADEVRERTGLSAYAVTCLLEAALTMKTVLVDTKTDRYTLAKTGWFLLNDPLIRADIDFNHDVNYEGWFRLDTSLEEGRPAGLEHFGSWPTIYEGLSQLPEQVQKSWFGFDHYYSDNSFNDAMKLIFANGSKHLLDVGGNTGKFARAVTAYQTDAQVTVRPPAAARNASPSDRRTRGREPHTLPCHEPARPLRSLPFRHALRYRMDVAVPRLLR